MLEFQEGFFEQEVRDGFYLDVTMKTLWAAELELLSKISGVCEKYGLQWYAAYGTLLGAIRHEGFVPWDDDMDIWMMRKDYNKLMKVLPDELPEGYRVRGPLTEEGYEQFHTCVNNGSGISIAKDWLEENHNCPFTVGIDIFPLDYLPRNKRDQETQKTLFTLIARVAQLAKGLYRGTFDEENSTATTEEVIAELKEGLKFIKKNYKFSIDHELIENKKWEKVCSEIWKWGNYVAMMYNENESDYIVEYLDWVKWPTKKYPKEWFSEVYAADFESVMVPIPWKYDEILLTIYSNYQIRARKTASHEYPFYARQLRQLKQYVKNAERGIFNSSIENVIEEKEKMPESIALRLEEARRSGKRIVLSANNTSLYINDGKRALDKLEENLEFFKKNTNKVLFWWRPHKMMSKMLSSVSAELSNRYEKVLAEYKRLNWGICDESDNVDWAVENCDVYYGEMNAIIQQFQNDGKAVILSGETTDDITTKNELMLLDSRTFVNFTDFVVDDNRMYFVNTNYNALVVVDYESKEIIDMIPFEGVSMGQKEMHLRCVKKNKKICFLPVGSGNARIYDINSGETTVFDFELPQLESKASWDSFEYGANIYLLPANLQQGVWLWDVENNSFVRQSWWSCGEADNDLKHSIIGENKTVSLLTNSKVIIVSDFEKKTVESYYLPDDDVCTIQGDGAEFWYTRWNNNNISYWNNNKKKIKHIAVPEEDYLGKYFTPYYYGSYKVDDNLFVLSRTCESIFRVDLLSGEVNCLDILDYSDWDYFPQEKEPYFKIHDNKLFIMARNTHKFRIVDLKSFEVVTYNNCFSITEKTKKYRDMALLERNVLLYEEQKVLDKFILLQNR